MRHVVWTALLWLNLAIASAFAEVVADPPDWTPTKPLPPVPPVNMQFELTNNGDAAVRILSASGTAGINVTLPRASLGPGESMTIEAVIRAFPGHRTPGIEPFKAAVVLQLDSEQDRLSIPINLRLQNEPEQRKVPERPIYQPRAGDQRIVAHFFYSKACGKCQKTLNEVVLPAQKEFAASTLSIELHDTTDAAQLKLLELYKAQYQVKEVASTYVFLGATTLVGGDDIEQRFRSLILGELQQPTPPPPMAVATGDVAGPAGTLSWAQTRMQRFTAPALLAAGLLDGCNPCAIATAVFLIALLSRLGHRRSTLLAVGVVYTLAVYVTYLLIGLGILRSLAWFGNRLVLIRLVDAAVGLVSLAFAGLQVRDVVHLRRGGATRELTMQMPHRWKQVAHAVLRENLARPLILLGALLAGVLVTLLEAVCTGQTYLPVLAAVAQVPAAKTRALALLALYNFGFVLPMVVILTLAYGGLTTGSMAAWAQRRVVPAKLALAGLLAALGVFLLAAARH